MQMINSTNGTLRLGMYSKVIKKIIIILKF